MKTVLNERYEGELIDYYIRLTHYDVLPTETYVSVNETK